MADTVGVPWTGKPGVTESVAEIMARQARRPPFSAEPHERTPDRIRIRRDLPQDPNALPVAQFPPADSSSQLSPQAPQSVGTSFLGGQISDTPGFIPPDSMGDVGPNQIVVCVNGLIRTFSKAGVADGALNADTDVFFAPVTGGNGTSDPRVRYDRLAGRWFIIMITVNTPNRIMIAVSSSSSITSTSSFTFFQYQHDLVGPTPNADTGGFADYDTLGVDNNALYIGTRMFTSSYVGATVFVVNKAALLTSTLTVTAFRHIGTSTAGIYTPQGVHNDDPAATEGYFVGIDLVTFGKLIVRRVSNPGGTPSISGDLNITVPTTGNPINPKPLGSTKTLSALDDRLFAAFMHKGSLWTSHNIQVDSGGVANSSGGRDGARWYELTNLTGAVALRQSGTLFDPAASSPNSYWIPSCAVSGQGHMALGSSVGGANEHAEIAVAGRFATDALGTIQTSTVAQTTSAAYNIQHTNGQRWGDYSVVTVDPNDDMTMWTVQEYCNAANSWGVRVIQLKAPPPATPASCAPGSVARGATTNVVVTGTVTNGSGFFDPGTGFPNHISAVVNGGSVTVNSVTYNNPTNITLNLTVGATAATGARTITVTNPDSQSATSAGILTIIAGGVTNSLPVINAASVTPALPSTTNDLFATVTSAFDADSDPITFTYQWQQATTNLAGQTASNLLAAVTVAGQSYRCVITPNDGHGNGAPFMTAAVLVPADFDGDGLNDDWEIANFGSLGAQTGSGDPDGDGFSNAQEFQAGSNPNNAGSAPLITGVTSIGANVVITFSSVAGKNYDVQRSDDLTGGWTTFTNVTADAASTQVTDEGGASQPMRFYRAQVLP